MISVRRYGIIFGIMTDIVLSGAEIVAKTLRNLNIDTVFGYAGSYAMPLIEKLPDFGIRFIAPTSEGAAAHAADGYYRASGKVAAVVTTSGPGATNLVTGIATAYMDSVPVLLITANVPTYKLGKDSFQEVDITGVVTPITKYAHIAKDIEELESEVKKAYALAVSHRMAPTLIDIPFDVMTSTCRWRALPVPEYPAKRFAPLDTERAAELINDSLSPAILAGGGALGSEKLIAALSEKLNCPIYTTLHGISSGYGENLYGSIGSSAPARINRSYLSHDLILALGTRFSDRMHSKPKNRTVIHVDSDAAEIDKTVVATLGVNAECAPVLEALIPSVNARNTILPPKPPFASRPKPLERLAAAALSAYDGNTVYATDVGSHQIAFLHSVRNLNHDNIVSSLGLGTMGFGLPGLIGALTATGKRGILVTGDGSFNMNLNELATAKSLGLDITVIVANNRSLGMIYDIEKRQGLSDKLGYAVDTPYVNYAALARAFGGFGKKVPLKNLSAELKNRRQGLNVFDVNIRG